MIHFMINGILFCIFGVMLATLGYPYYTWQFWGLMVLAVAIYFNGLFKGHSN